MRNLLRRHDSICGKWQVIVGQLSEYSSRKPMPPSRHGMSRFPGDHSNRQRTGHRGTRTWGFRMGASFFGGRTRRGFLGL